MTRHRGGACLLALSLMGASAVAAEQPEEVVEGAPLEAATTERAQGFRFAEALSLSGYVQGEYHHRQDSVDEVHPDGSPLNGDRFLLRRARLKLEAEYEWAGAIFELEASTRSGGFSAGVRRAEAFLHLRPDPDAAPLLRLGAGVVDARFGYDLGDSSRTRPFAERALIVRSIWPSPADVGATLEGSWRWFNASVQALNGQPKGQEGGFPGLAPTQAKDLLVRLGVDAPVSPRLRVSGHLSTLQGKGFHPGSPATKGGLGWRDQNEDGVIQQTELSPVPARAAIPSSVFDRWAVGGDLQVRLLTRLGETLLYGELIAGEDMDRGLFVSNPTLTGLSQRMLGYHVSLVQELFGYGFVGARWDVYDPDADLFEQRAGQLHPLNQRITTWSAVAGLELPSRARLLFQYDVVQDALARDARGVPADLANDQLTVRLQVEL